MLSYSSDKKFGPESFRDLLERSTLAERRPVGDLAVLKGMLENSDLILSCWDDRKLVGVARSVTDFSYCCYLSDLAVDMDYQRQGIGKQLISKTRQSLEDTCKVILLSAPGAVDYYPHIGFEKHPSAWVLK